MKTCTLIPKNLFPRLLISLMFVCYPFTVLVAAEPTVTLEGELSELLQTPNNPGLKTRDSRRAGTTKPGWDTQLFDVEVVLRMPPGRPPACGSGSVSVQQDGTVTRRMLNGKIASEDDLAQAQSDCGNRLFNYLSERETIREQRYQQLMAELTPMMNKSYNAQHQLHHAQSFPENRGSAVRLKLTGAEIKAFAARYGDMAEVIRPYHKPVSESHCGTIGQVLEATDMDTAYPRGTGIGVYMSESAGCHPDANTFNPMPYSQHGDFTYQILDGAAPDAEIWCGFDFQFPSIQTGQQHNIRIWSHSWGVGNPFTGTYTSNDRDWDRLSYDRKVAIFKSAGNLQAFVTSPGRGFNIITVGGSRLDGKFYRYSNYLDPSTGAEKPEIVAPALYKLPGSACNAVGTSFSTPLAAGAAARLMSRYPYSLPGRPYLTKAALMATALNIKGHPTLSDEDGAGVIDFNYLYPDLAWYEGSENGAPNTVSDSGGYALKVTAPLYSLALNQTSRVVLAWMVRDDSSRQRWDLEVIRPDGTVLRAYNNGSTSAFRIIDFQVGRPSGSAPQLQVDYARRWVFYSQDNKEHCRFGGTPNVIFANRCIVKTFSSWQSPPSNAPRLYVENDPRFPWVFYWQSTGGQCVHGGHTPSATWTNRCIVRQFETSTRGFKIVRRLLSTTGEDTFIGWSNFGWSNFFGGAN